MRSFRPVIIATFAATALIAWLLFHPDFSADHASISPPVKAELAKTGFSSVSRVEYAVIRTTRTVDGIPETLDVEQRLSGIDGLLTEKRTRRRAKYYFEELDGLYVGPLTVLRYKRSVLPVIASLFPNQFWVSMRMSALEVQSVDQEFPRRSGGRLLARVSYEYRYSDGKLYLTEHVQLRCIVGDVLRATSINSQLSGLVSRINCEERPAPTAQVTAVRDESPVLEEEKYSHLYVHDLGWSIPAEGETTVRFQEGTAKETWKSELKSFATSRIHTP